ncbi:allene oxide cyclase barrel-like domain-containing protein [Georgenia yuyongxinii]
MDVVIAESSFTDNGGSGPSLGDEMIVFTNTLLSEGREAGHEGTVCTTVSTRRQEAQCIATFSFEDGQLTAQGLVVLGSTDPYAVPITAGSGKYRGADGELRITPVSDSAGRLVLRLIDR